MQTLQLFLNDQLCDLSDTNPIALSFQINNLADVKNQAGNTSNQFKLPLTQQNRRILGYPDDIKINNHLPYTQYKARIIQDGIEILPEGLGVLASSDENTASISIVSGNTDFFDSLDNPIYEMGDSTKIIGKKKLFSPYTHTWNLANVVASRANTSGYIYPVIDYGNLSQFKPYKVDVRTQRPGFFLKTAIDLIVSGTGYKATGSLLSDPLYNKLIVQFANDSFDHGTDYQLQPDTLGMTAYTTQDKAVSHIPIYDNKGILSFPRIDLDPKLQFDGTYFTAKQIFTGEVLLTIPKFSFRGRRNDRYPSNVNIIIYLETPTGNLEYVLNYDLTNYTRVPGTSGGGLQGYYEFGLKTLLTQIDFKVGYRISVRYEFFGDRPAWFTMFSGAYLNVKAKNANVIFGQDVQCERIFPDISEKDLLKDTLQRFGIICQTDNTSKTVTFASFKDIVKNVPLAKDWTKKCLDQGKNVTYQLGNYGQQNYLKYKEDQAIKIGYADDVINVNDKTLPITVDLFTSVFSPSLNSQFVGGQVGQIKKIDTVTTVNAVDFTIGTSPRILVQEVRSLFNGNSGDTVEFTDGTTSIFVNDFISTAYFYKPNGAFSLMWKDKDGTPGLRSLYYRELERILKKTKKVTRHFLLTARDIQELDLLIPIYLEQDNAYYYINKIDQWRKGKETKVELVKLGEI